VRFAPLILMVMVTAGFIILHDAFSMAETMEFNIRFLIITALMMVFLFREISVPRFRPLTFLLIILPVLLISQTRPQEESEFIKQRKVFGSITLGHYYNEVRYNPHTGTCGTAYDEEIYENKIFAISGGYSVRGWKGYQNYEYGGFLTGGTYTEININTSSKLTRPLIIASPFAEYNWHWVGLGMDAKIGYVPFLPLKPYDTHSAPDKNHRITPIMPGFMVRVGPYDWLDARLKFSYGFPEPLPAKIWDISLGTGFGFKNGSGLRVGTTYPIVSNIYFEGRIMFDKKFGLLAKYMHGESYSLEGQKNNEFSMGFNYILGK